MKPEESSISMTLLLEAVVSLIDPKLPWVCNIVGYLLQRRTFSLFREIALAWKVCFYQHLFLHFFSLFSSSLVYPIEGISYM